LSPFILCPRNIIGGRGKKLKGGGNTRDFHSRNKIGAKGFSPPRISPRVTSRGQGCEASWGFFVKNESMPAGSRRSRRCALGHALSAMRSRRRAPGDARPAMRSRRGLSAACLWLMLTGGWKMVDGLRKRRCRDEKYARPHEFHSASPADGRDARLHGSFC